MPNISRRKFLGISSAAVSSFMILPRNVLGGKGYTAPSDKLDIAAIGIGGQGAWDLENLKSENIIALCDVDQEYAAETFKLYPKAKKYRCRACSDTRPHTCYNLNASFKNG